MDQIKIGQFIAEIRREKGLTQGQIGEKLLVSDKAVSKWECGNGLPNVSLMMPLCDILGINLNELLSGEYVSEEGYRKRAEENIIKIIEEREKSQQKSVLTILENYDIYSRVKEQDKFDFKYCLAVIDTVCEIAECAEKNGLLELRKYLDNPDIDSFLKELIDYSTSDEKLLSENELFDTFSVRIITQDITGEMLIKHLIMLQGYMYILQGNSVDRVRDKLVLSFTDGLNE